MNDNKNSKNIYEPFSYNYPSNGTLPINEKNPMSNSNNSLKNSKKTEPFSYNYRDTESNSNEIEDTSKSEQKVHLKGHQCSQKQRRSLKQYQ